MVSTSNRKLLAAQELEKRKCKKSFAYFVNTFCMMWVKEGGDPIQFKLWEFQKEAADTFQHEKKVIVLKARQMGMSWLAMAYVVWCVLYKPNFHVYITSIGLKEVNEQMERIRFIWYNLPEWLRGDVVLGGKGLKDNDSLIELSNGSAIHAIASTKSGGHGAAPGLYVLDEFARKENDVMAWRAIKPSLGKKSQVLIISTSDGLNNLFATLWFGAQSKNNDFKPVFFSCHQHPEYTEEYLAEMKNDFAGDIKGYLEAFPETPEDAFVASSRTIFDGERIRDWKQFNRSEHAVPYKVGELEEEYDKRAEKMNIKFIEGKIGRLTVWRAPIKGHHYTVGTDLAEGIVTGDWSVSAVLDTDTNEIVAMYRGKIAPEEYSYPVRLLATWYNNAWLCIEVNKNSSTIMNDLKTSYPFLYTRPQREKITDVPTQVPGFLMGGHNKRPLIIQLRRAFSDNEKPLRIYSNIALDEFSIFEEDEHGKLNAARGEGNYDDCVIAIALAVEAKNTMPTEQAGVGRANLFEDNSVEAKFFGTGRAKANSSWRSF